LVLGPELDLDAVRESLAEWRAGDPGVLLEDAFDAIRGRHGLGDARCPPISS
jgi:hypothetical protein